MTQLYRSESNGSFVHKGQSKVKDHNHLYLYTLQLIDPITRELGEEVFVEAYNLIQAAYKLGKTVSDVIYVHKVIL